jgi:hypothetical protein
MTDAGRQHAHHEAARRRSLSSDSAIAQRCNMKAAKKDRLVERSTILLFPIFSGWGFVFSFVPASQVAFPGVRRHRTGKNEVLAKTITFARKSGLQTAAASLKPRFSRLGVVARILLLHQ